MKNLAASFWDFDRYWLNNYFRDMIEIFLLLTVLMCILCWSILAPFALIGEWIHSKFDKGIG